MTTALEHKRRIEFLATDAIMTEDREAFAWALKEIKFLQNKCKELRAAIPLDPARD